MTAEKFTQKVLKTHTLNHPHWDGYSGDDDEWHHTGITIEQLRLYMEGAEIPADAKIRYAGCGSHLIEFAWYAEEVV